jgi:beta-lactam-binding protein with PASTA domain
MTTSAGKVVGIAIITSIVVSLIVCLAFALWLWPYLEGRTRETAVSDLEGLSLEEARAVLSAQGLGLTIQSMEPNERVPVGHVVAQDPQANSRVALGTHVSVVLSRGPGSLTVPNVVGLSLAVARNRIEQTGLTVGEIMYQGSSSVPAGHVVKTEPPAGSGISPKSAVILTVTPGKTISVPYLYGLSLRKANAQLEAAGLSLGRIRYVTDTEHRFDVVITQDPKSGTMVEAGHKVSLTINREAHD